MRLLIVTDAWKPQTNGVVTTLVSVIAQLEGLGHEVRVLEPGCFRTVPLPSYPEIRIAINPWRIGRLIREIEPDAVHIATEGPLGFAARRYLRRHGLPFTTSLHTKFPEYAHARWRIPTRIGYALLRRFHRPAEAVLVTTDSHRHELLAHGFERLQVWGRGVDTERFRPQPRRRRTRPRLLYVGRVAVEKNLEAFLELDIEGDKVVVGDGPARASLESRFPQVAWLGYRYADELVACYAEADVLVFPSLTDTFGLVMLEAMACGTPVAAFPVTGPIDVVVEGVNGALDKGLRRAIERALLLDRRMVRRFAESQGWRAIAERLLSWSTHVTATRPRCAGSNPAARTATGQLDSVATPIEQR